MFRHYHKRCKFRPKDISGTTNTLNILIRITIILRVLVVLPIIPCSDMCFYFHISRDIDAAANTPETAYIFRLSYPKEGSYLMSDEQ
jgi:hypothetical protein